ncbi:MAG: hypothetical protein ACJ73S_14350 [Mycobacteriales bacterium]
MAEGDGLVAQRAVDALVRGRARHPSLGAAVTTLQRTAGNRAVSGMLRVQRHSSWEHALLGDTPPKALGQAAVSNAARKHVVAEEWERMKFFQNNPRADPTSRFPDVRWIKLRGSGLWVSNGELNALGDYLPDPSAYDTLTADQLIPVLQKMRGVIMGSAGAEFNLHDDSMKGAADSWLPGAAGEVKALDNATAGLGTNRYAGLVSRNACHFAPFSWERWSLYHTEAATEARLHHDAMGAVTPLRVVDTSVEEHERQALLKNGYADHFLQDSFAAGHLVNKTLVMQWFVDYLNGMNWLDRPWIGVPGADVMKRMGSRQQTGVAGTDRYGKPPTSDRTSGDDRWTGTDAIDPQTAQERYSREGRMAGSGVTGANPAEREANYQAYLAFLNSSFLQLAAGAAHDYFNKHGLLVENDNGDRMAVGGDDTMLSKSGPLGAMVAGLAASKSRQAIDDLMRTGATEWTVDRIFGFVPQRVVIPTPKGGPGKVYSLAEFQQEVLHDLCMKQLFPELLDSAKSDLVRYFGSRMVDGGISQDSPGGKARPLPPGDYPVPTGGSSSG